MSCHRIQKYSRQIVCQDCILSCQVDHIEEIPLLKRAKISSLSLQDQKANPKRSSGTVTSPWSEKDLDLSGILMSWYLCNKRGIPFSSGKKKVKSRLHVQRRTTTEKGEKKCHVLLTLRGDALYTLIEKYLLFLLPRFAQKERRIDLLDQSVSRRHRARLVFFYIVTALGLRKYKISDVLSQDSSCKNLEREERGTRLSQAAREVESPCLPLSPERISFPSQDTAVHPSSCSSSWIDVSRTLHVLQSKGQGELGDTCNHLRALSYENLFLHSCSLLSSPDIQEIAQLGLATLEGSLTLEISLSTKVRS